jgi:hypothetical protein
MIFEVLSLALACSVAGLGTASGTAGRTSATMITDRDQILRLPYETEREPCRVICLAYTGQPSLRAPS